MTQSKLKSILKSLEQIGQVMKSRIQKARVIDVCDILNDLLKLSQTIASSNNADDDQKSKFMYKIMSVIHITEHNLNDNHLEDMEEINERIKELKEFCQPYIID